MTSVTPSTVRLTYTLSTVAQTQRVLLIPLRDKTVPLNESEVRRLRPSLHPLDKTIVQEICQGTMFGQLTDSQLARLLPLLAQRRTHVQGTRLEILETTLRPRASMTFAGGGVFVRVYLENKKGEPVSWESGRLLAGSNAYWLKGFEATPITCPTPAGLLAWSQQSGRLLTGDKLSAAGREALKKEMALLGVPEEDVESLAVHRGPPLSFEVRVDHADFASPEVEVGVSLTANYAWGAAEVEAVRQEGGPSSEGALLPAPEESEATEDTSSAEATPHDAMPEILSETEEMEEEPDEGVPAVVERDWGREQEARQTLRGLGFVPDRGRNLFVARGEQALRLLDPEIKVLPPGFELERNRHVPVFRRDLTLATQVRLAPDTGLLDLSIAVHSPDDDGQLQALIDMRELLQWLGSKGRYVRLSDGSFAAPSARLKEGLRIVRDLGAENDRVLISPLCVGLLRAMGDIAALTAADEITQEWLSAVAHADTPAQVEIPDTVAAELRDYQHRGVDWLMMLNKYRLTGVLADDMGLGKTLQTLCLLAVLRAQAGQKPSLVVAPTSVVGVWRDEAHRFVPSLKVVLWQGPPNLRRDIKIGDADLVVTSYGILRRDADLLAEVGFRYVIADEAQSTKNAASHSAHAIRRLKSEQRLALSGTPLENRPEELWSIFDFLAPGFLGTLRAFRRNYARPIQRGDQDARGLLRMRLAPLILRRLKSEVAQELPDKVESTLRCEMGSSQRALYNHVAGKLRETLREKIAKAGIQQAQLDILAALTRLRQICCDPALLPAPNVTRVPPSAKLAMFEELMREALASERNIVVFSQFVTMQKKLVEIVKSLGVEPLWLHGGTRDRDKVVASFQDPKGPPVIIVSLKAGGTGVTLTRADTVVHYDPWWNPAVERQATDRAHRLGQTSTVSVYRLICADSIEEKVIQMAERKEALARDLLSSEGGQGAKHISYEDVLGLLS